jgi:putative ABC transport system permease protein
MIVPKLALRGLVRNRKSSLVLVGLVGVGVFLFLLGDSALGAASSGIRREFQDGYTGDAAVRSVFERKFGIFGFSVPTIGEYEEMPTLPEVPAIRTLAARLPAIAKTAEVVSGAALLQGPKGCQVKVPVFGVVAGDYFPFFPALRFVRGATPPPDGEAWIVLPRSRAEEIEKAEGRAPAVNDELQFTMASGNAFTIRAVRLAGIVDTPIKGQADTAPVYTDPTTLRALLGLPLGNARKSDESAAAAGAPADDLSSFFSGTAGAAAGEEPATGGAGAARGLDLVAQYLGNGAGAAPEQTIDVEQGAWHFLLLRLAPGARVGSTLHALNSEFAAAGIKAEAVGWLSVAGLNAGILFLLKTIFEIGIGILAAVIVLVLTNGLAFSVIEQTKEIGTMRAMGAQRSFVARLYFLQSLLIVAAGVALGSLAAWLALHGLSGVGIPITNSYLYMLFGVSRLRPVFLPGSALAALGASVIVAAAASIYPMALAARASVAQTMAAE